MVLLVIVGEEEEQEMPSPIFTVMILLMIVGLALLLQHIPLPVAPVILNPDIIAPFVEAPLKVTAFPENGGSMIGIPIPTKAIRLSI